MIIETFSNKEVAEALVRNNVETRIRLKTMSSPEFLKAKKSLKSIWKNLRKDGYPVVFKNPVKLEADRNEYYSVIVSEGKGKVDFNSYLRVYSGKLRRYKYYTFPIEDATAGRPAGYCFEFSPHYIERYEGRCPLFKSGNHFLVAIVKDIVPEAQIIPIGAHTIWQVTRTGLSLCVDNVYLGYYRKLSEFTLENRASYKKYWEDYHKYLPIPSLKDILVKLWRNEKEDEELCGEL